MGDRRIYADSNPGGVDEVHGIQEQNMTPLRNTTGWRNPKPRDPESLINPIRRARPVSNQRPRA